ncbi:D-alanyl-D-alanine carboxypeptidase family protein [Streptomyces sp. SCSIO 30461]|uniref:RHS repeat-associated core domain-containing protein n=1 Tax=Streptomyces sp. SCSIO 30461 TaxID=3118085 RepID=UPI0030CC6379
MSSHRPAPPPQGGSPASHTPRAGSPSPAARRGRRRGRITVALIASFAALVTSIQLAPATSWAAAGGDTPPAPPRNFGYKTKTFQPADPAGYLPGELEVSPTGEATYTVPLTVPDGPGKTTPTLKLTYSSRSGNGLLGKGWSISGLSSINRCGRKFSTEGKQTGVHFQDKDGTDWDADRFCLDGQKLMAVNGDYGASGTEYRTEKETFTKVVSHDSDDSGPRWFQVWTRDGRIREYRMQTAARMSADKDAYHTATATTVRPAWLLTRESDRSGNSIDYTYTYDKAPFDSVADDLSLQLLPDEIRYSTPQGNTRRRYVKFQYEDRPDDKGFAWQSGVRQHLHKRLAAVEMHGPNPDTTQLLWSYRLDYETGQWSKHSRLSSVQKCGHRGGCLWKKKFSYSDQESAPFKVEKVVDEFFPDGTDDLPFQPMVRPVDMSGDGADDLAFSDGRAAWFGKEELTFKWGEKAETGSVSPVSSMAWPMVSGFGNAADVEYDMASSRPVDLNADGQIEFVVRRRASEDEINGTFDLVQWDMLFRKPASSVKGFDKFSLPKADSVDFGDLNGDGLPDMIWSKADEDHSRTWRFQINEGTKFSSSRVLPLQGSNKRLSFVDVDGDGRIDINDGTRVVGLRDDGSIRNDPAGKRYPVPATPLPDSTPLATAPDTLVWGDVNGDGLLDAASVHWTDEDGVSEIRVRYSTGAGFGPAVRLSVLPEFPQARWGPERDMGVRVADMDRDGRDDFVIFHGKTESNPWGENYAGITILYATGARKQLTDAATSFRGWRLSQLGDFDGDGWTDIVTYDDGGLDVLTNGGQAVDLLTEVSDEHSSWPREKITYATEWSSQPRAVNAAPGAYPTVPLRQRGMMFARKVESRAHWLHPASAELDASKTRVMEYSYENPMLDLRGRGFLGFGSVRVWDSQRPSETVTEYDNLTRVSGKYYPFAQVPRTVTTATPILDGDRKIKNPGEANARVTRTTFTYAVNNSGGKTYWTHPADSALDGESGSKKYNKKVEEWEQPVTIDWNLDDERSPAPRTHIYDVSWLPAAHDFARVTYYASDTDGWGNVRKSQRRTENAEASKRGVTEEMATDYETRVGDWLLGLPTKTATTRIEADDTPDKPHRTTRTVEHDYDDAGRPTTTWVERGNPDPGVRRTTTTTYGDQGEVRHVKDESPGAPARSTHHEYAPLLGPDEKIYPSQVWSSHDKAEYRPSTWTITHPGFGVPLAEMDANGVETSTHYDDLGRVVRSRPAGQTPVATSYAAHSDSYQGVSGVETTTERGQEKSRIVTDALGRTVATLNQGFDGALLQTDTLYDRLGRVELVSRPHPANQSPSKWTKNVRDSLDRLLTTTGPDGRTVRNTHTFFETRTFDAENNERRITTDLDGRTVSSVNIKGHDGKDVPTAYQYEPFDVQEKVTAPGNRVTVREFDTLGRATRVTEPNTGTTGVAYNGFGDPTRQSRSEDGGIGRTYTYDDLGRKTAVVDYANHGADTAATTTWEWDSSPHGIGKLASTTSPDDVTTAYRYDSYSRVAGTDYTDPAGTVYSVDQTYTPDTGKTATLVYPAAEDGRRLTIKNTYNPYGHLTSIADATPGGTPVPVLRNLWTVKSRTDDLALEHGTLGQQDTFGDEADVERAYEPGSGRLKSITVTRGEDTPVMDLHYTYYGNGLTKTRVDDRNHRKESFTYDPMARLTDWTLATHTDDATSADVGGRTVRYGYTIGGDLTQVSINGDIVEANSYTDPSHPDAVTGYAGPTRVGAYTYDALGRQKTGAGRTWSYRSLNLLPSTITAGDTKWRFTYDADGSRFSKSDGTHTTTYIGGIYEKRQKGDKASHIYHVSGPDGPVAEIAYAAGSKPQVTYTQPDALGSTSAVIAPGGQVSTTFYEPFGHTTEADGAPTTGPTGGVRRGFTGHEHDSDLGLINMKGRLYDPATRRFTTPDPVNGNPLFGQRWNPYSYVNNNPLNSTDPTGYDPSLGESGNGPGFEIPDIEIPEIETPDVSASTPPLAQCYACIGNLAVAAPEEPTQSTEDSFTSAAGEGSTAEFVLAPITFQIEWRSSIDLLGGMTLSLSPLAPPNIFGSAASDEVPPAMESPGGGRIQDKSSPDPADLVKYPGTGVYLHKLVAEQWQKLVASARADGIPAPYLVPGDGYRPRDSGIQEAKWAEALKKYGDEATARLWVAKPGGSAHHSGRALDFNNGYPTDSEYLPQHKTTAAYQWMLRNAERFGFYEYKAIPGTPAKGEPWHWEYNPPMKK